MFTVIDQLYIYHALKAFRLSGGFGLSAKVHFISNAFLTLRGSANGND